MIEEIGLQVLREFGFPVVAFLLMYRLVDTTVKDNTTALHELRLMLKDCKKVLK